jgi:RND superfamily putative drug exporter
MFYRLGLAAVRLRWWILACWLGVMVVALPFAPRAPQALSPGGFSSPDMESARAVDTLQRGLHANFTNLYVIFTSNTSAASDPRFQAESTSALAGLQHWDQVTQILPFTLNPAQVSRDGHTAYDTVFLKASGEDSPKVLPALYQRLRAPKDLRMTVGGGPVFYADIQSVSEADLRRAEEIAFPFALLALLLVFRSVVAAGLPAAVGGCSVVASLALLYALARASTVSVFALNITTLFGLGLGVDYSLFMVSRFREELAKGRAVPEAVGITMSTAGRAVFFSGLAVSIGLLGLVLFPLNMLRSVGLGGMLTVAMAILAAVTLLPALLGVLGPRVNALPVRLPRLWRHAAPTGEQPGGRQEEHGFWHRLASGVMAHPVAVFAPVLALLLLFGSPYLSVRLAAPDASILPESVPSRQGYDLLEQKFDLTEIDPIILAVKTTGSPLSTANLQALDTYVRRLEADPRVSRVDSIVTLDPRLSLAQYEAFYQSPSLIADPYITESLAAYAGDHVTMVQVIGKYGMLDPRSEALVQAIRATPPGGGMSIEVTGGTAGIIDYVNTLYTAFPQALAVVGLITFVVLLLLFRSIVLPVKAIVMNALSITATYGALVFIFQEGHLSHLLNFTPLGFVEASAPILMFCAIFGLSMDYEVFLLSRIREAYEHTGDNTRSVALGMERSGGIITSAAAIVILVSASFASAGLVIVKEVGVGMALAVLLDATLVRGLLVPATMRLLGDLNWWWPWPFNRLLPGVVFTTPETSASDTAISSAPSAVGTSETDALPVGGD